MARLRSKSCNRSVYPPSVRTAESRKQAATFFASFDFFIRLSFSWSTVVTDLHAFDSKTPFSYDSEIDRRAYERDWF